MASNWNEPPGQDEVEVALFGPGKGECVVVHLGEHEWLVVDSCLDHGSPRRPAASAYLDSIGVPPAAIKLVVASHWHDDHVGGLATLVRQATNAKVVCSAAFEPDEFLQVVSAADLRPMVKGTSGVHEFCVVLDQLAEAGSPPTYAAADRVIHRRGGAQPCEVSCLSPSDASVRDALVQLRLLLEQQVDDQRTVVPRPLRNPNAVAIGIEVGAVTIILGGDLEGGGDPQKGWSAVLSTATRPAGLASLFKVSHHGSLDGHDDAVWSEMLVRNAHAALTPYLGGKYPVPRPSDISRLTTLSSNVWITRRPGTPTPRRDWRVQRMIEEVTNWVHPAEPHSAGALRFRRPIDGSADWRVHGSGAAERLS